MSPVVVFPPESQAKIIHKEKKYSAKEMRYRFSYYISVN